MVDKVERDNQRDDIRDSNDPEITRRAFQVMKPEWLLPNVRLKLQHFLPKEIPVVNTEQDYMVYFHNTNEKMEVYSFVRRLFEEHNSSVLTHKYRNMYIETAYLFCMDIAESTMSSNFFQYIPKHFYRRYLEEVPLFYATKACIIVDYYRRLAYRFGLCISKMTDEIDAHSEDRQSMAEANIFERPSSVRGVSMHRRRGTDDFLFAGKQCTMEDIMIINRIIHVKRHDSHS